MLRSVLAPPGGGLDQAHLIGLSENWPAREDDFRTFLPQIVAASQQRTIQNFIPGVTVGSETVSSRPPGPLYA
jgi:hypothetical protein